MLYSIEDKWIVSKGPFISLRVDDLDSSNQIGSVMEIYKKYGLVHSYKKDERYFHFMIFNKVIDFIIRNAIYNSEMKNTFQNCNFYISVSSRFVGTTITNNLNESESAEYYIQIPPELCQYDDSEYDKHVEIKDFRVLGSE